MIRIRPVHIAAAAGPVLSALAAALTVALPSSTALVMVLGAGLGVLGAAFAVAAVIGSFPRRAWTLLAVSLGFSAIIADPMVRMLARPLNVSAVDALLPAALLVVALFLARKAPLSVRDGWIAALAVTAASGGIIASSFGQVWDLTALFMWTVGTAGIALLGGVVLVRVLRGEKPAALIVLLGVLGALGAVGAAVRQYALFALEEVTSAGLGDALVIAGAAALIMVAVALATWALPSSLVKRQWVRVPAVIVAFTVFLGAGSAAALPLEVPADSNVLTAREMAPTDLIMSSSMLEEIGAMPRDEFRGKSFYECDALNSRDCFITHYDDIALKYGVNTAIQDVVGKVKENKGATFPAHCHQVIHNLGQLAYTLSETFEEAAELDPQVCGTGYTHGLWEQQFTVMGDEPLFTRTATLCDELNMKTPWYRWTCGHILGHMISTRMMDNSPLAMEYCDLITDTQIVTDCLAGGWMNFFQDDKVIAEMVSRGSLLELFSVCYSAADEVKFLCYQELFPVVYPMVGQDDYLAAQACLTLAEPGKTEGDAWGWDVSYADRCIQGMARAIAVSSFQDYRVIGPRCLGMPEEARDPCLTASAASVVLNTGATKPAFELCRKVGDEGYRLFCYFWAKHSRKLLANGPNSTNLPGKDEIRLPESPRWYDSTGASADEPADAE